MGISSYSELKTAISDWMDRTDLSGSAEDFITLAEARLNRLIELVEVQATLTGTASSRNVDISSLSVIEPMAVYLSLASGDEVEIAIKPAGSFPYHDTNSLPGFVAVNGSNLTFDHPLDASYSIRFQYRGRFALSDAAPTNDLLTNHPDVYLAASIMWGGIYIADQSKVMGFKALLDEFIVETKSHISQKKRGIASPDPALVGMTRRSPVSDYFR